LGAIVLVALFFVPRAEAQIVATYTWADGGLDGWVPFGSPTLTNVMPSLQDPSGDSHALLTTNRTASFMGPSIDLLNDPNLKGKIVAGATYQVSAYVLLAAPDANNPTVTITTKLTNCAGTTFPNVSSATGISDTQWTKVQGNLSFSDEPGPPTGLVLYIQSSSPTDSFYIDHVVINEVAPPPNPADQDNTGISTNFEDGGLDGWSDRLGAGNATVTNSTAAAHTGTHSLLTTGRTHNYDGPQISVANKMYDGSQYNLSAWVMLVPTDNSNHTINMSLQANLNNSSSFPSITAYPGVTIQADGQWHQISVKGFNMANAYDSGGAFVYFQTVPSSGNDLVSFYIDDFQLTFVPPAVVQTNIPSIFQTLSPYFPVGAEVDPIDLSGPHAQLLTMHFDSLVSGNDMKWSSVENTKGSFTYTNADNEVGLAVCKGMRIRGHNLVWSNGSQTPSYAFGDKSNSAANQMVVTANIQEHIQNEVTHFGAKVDTWDVVNEPLDPSQSDCLQHGPFYNVLGKSYIDIALQAARAAAPNAKLFINDYSTADPNRLACLVQVVNDLKSRGIPIDGVGHEMHNAINYPSPSGMNNAISTMAENFPGLIQEVTELDESVYHTGDLSDYGTNVPASVLAEQGWLYKAYFDVFRNLSSKLSRVTFWGMADDDTWLDGFPVTRTDYPLPFDRGLQAKLAYWGIVDPSHLPGYGMTFSAKVTKGPRIEVPCKHDHDDDCEHLEHHLRTLTITATNGNVGPAYSTLLTGLKLTQERGRPCTPTLVSPPSFPVSLGDIATSGTASASFTVSIKGCTPESKFTLSVPWTSATWDTGTLTKTLDFDIDQDFAFNFDREEDH
jgi:endo-1,4-beta-xylanase